MPRDARLAAQEPAAPVRRAAAGRRRDRGTRCSRRIISAMCCGSAQGAELLMFDGSRANGSRAIADAGKRRMSLNVEAGRESPRRSPTSGSLRAGQARADRLAGRESDRARRRAADPGDDPADGRPAGEARAPAKRSRSRPPSNAAGRALPGIAEPRAAASAASTRSPADALFRRRRRRRAAGGRFRQARP